MQGVMRRLRWLPLKGSPLHWASFSIGAATAHLQEFIRTSAGNRGSNKRQLIIGIASELTIVGMPEIVKDEYLIHPRS
jgi:hypothetical protein